MQGGGRMSPLHHSHIGESLLHSAQHHGPDSELRDALQRVARDLEYKTQRQKHHEGQGMHSEGTRKDNIGHDAEDIQVEDILDHAALEAIQGDDMATFQSSTSQPDASLRGEVNIRQLAVDPHLVPTGDFQARVQSRTPSLRSVSTDETSKIMLASLKCIPSMGFMKFLDDWLEARGLKAADAPSPVVEDWTSLESDQRSRHEARARFRVNMQRSGKTSDEADHQSTTSHSGTSAIKPRRASSRHDTTADADEKAASMIGRTFSETEKIHIGDVVNNIVQELDVLYQSTGTNYLLLSAPVFQAPDDFPVLAHSPPAASFWQSLRGGPGTNLTKFLALSHPAVTSRRLAIPTGARSLDVKSRLNASMRQMIREASNVADAEMKWTRPESLVQIYGVKIIGWPMGSPGSEDEMVPMRNPSNNSVAQNKLLLQRIEDGVLRVEVASDEDRMDVTGVNDSHLDHQEAPARSHSGVSDSSRSVLPLENDSSLHVEGEEVYEDATASELLDRASDSVRRGPGRPPKLRGIVPSSRSKYRSKSLLTLNPDGSIRPGGLDGKRKPGRPRKTVTNTPVNVPLASTRFEYHLHQQRPTRDQRVPPEDQVEAEDAVEEPVDPQSLYIQQEELGEASSEVAMAIIGPSLENAGEADESQYTTDTVLHNEQQRENGVHQQSHSDHLPSPLDQALSHIEYYQVTGPNFDNHSSHEVPVSTSHNLSNIAPHFPLPPPEEVHVGSHHTSIHEEQEYISDFTTRMPTINPYNTHFAHATDQGDVEHEPWHEQRDSEDASTESADGGRPVEQVSLRDIQNHDLHVEDNPDIVDGIDMEAAFGNHELSSADSLSDRSDIGDMSDAHMRAYLVSQPPLLHQNDGDNMAEQSGKRKVDEMGHEGSLDDNELMDGITKRSKHD